MAIYDIREAKTTEVSAIQGFIDVHWKKNHSLVLSKVLLDFQHLNSLDNQYNYIIASNKNTKEIDALFGFIPTYQYDRDLYNNGDFWGAIWKKRDDIDNEESNEIGMDVFTRLFDYSNFHSFSAIGISKIAMKIYKAFQCKIGYLTQYYILNDSIDDYKIAGNVDIKYFGVESGFSREPNWSIKEIDADALKERIIKAVYRPFKSIQYIINRYAKHPIFKYKFLGVYKDVELKTLLVIRILNVNGAKAIRIVDAIGQLQGNLYDVFQTYLKEMGAEYIDFMNFGINEDVFYKMGFRKLNLEEKLIIPNYFEPFEQRNVKIDIAWKADYEGYVAFKGDSDQDRPNIL